MSSLASARRDRCPPESVATFCSHVSRPRPTPSSVASSLCCQAYPPARSKSCWTVWYCVERLLAARRPSSSAISCSRSRRRWARSCSSANASSASSMTVLAGSNVRVLREVADLRRRWRSRRRRRRAMTSPVSILNSVVLPAPLAPMKPMRSPRSMLRFSLSKMTRLPKVFSMLARVAMGIGASRLLCRAGDSSRHRTACHARRRGRPRK